jgi:hypothetical protein
MIEAPQHAGAATDVDQAGSRCRNCGASVASAFCPNCGQETALRLPTLREFVREAAGRYVAFDGRFWRTMRALLIRPGFLTHEYLEGRRRRYIRPARLYLFSTLIFFAVSRFFVEPGGTLLNDEAASRHSAKGARTEQSEERKVAKENAEAKGGDVSGFSLDDDFSLHLPAEVGGAVKSLEKRWNRFNVLPRNEKGDRIVAGMLRYGPYAMFALLPAFALLLKVLYLGPRRRYPHRPRLYGEHMVFAAHGHAFVFVAATLALLIGEGVARTAIVTWICVYLLWSMHAVYGGSWVGVIFRSFCLFVAYSALLGIATAGLVIAAILLD